MSVLKNNLITKENKKSTKLSMIVFGGIMVGKTTFADTFPKPLFINTDGNFENISNLVEDKKVLRVNEEPGLSRHKSVVKMIEDVINSKQELIDAGYKTLVFDTIDGVCDSVFGVRAEEFGVEDIVEISDHGKTISQVRKLFYKTVEKIINTFKDDFHLVFISYDGKKTNTFDEQVQDMIVPSVIGQITSEKKKNENNFSKLLQITARLRMSDQNIKGEDGITRRIPVRTLVLNPSKLEECGNRFSVKGEILEPTYEKLAKAIIEVNKEKK